ncbi:MAG: efflux transporter periplasmic adaptor subunit [Ramlibacter sp.]|nr:efflux transporter periplasmic adaptor subunit [Ramlibacter sp.]
MSLKNLRWKWIAAGLVVLLLAGGLLRTLAARKAQQPGADAAVAVQPVVELALTDVVQAQLRELQRGLPVSGSLKAVNSAFVKVRIPGELQGLTVREGDTVRAGQVIARVDPFESQARLKQAQEQADAAKAQIDIAERQWNNNKSLVDQGFISRSAVDNAQNSLTAAQSNHKAALAAVDLVRKSLDDAVLRAPIGGVVAQRLAQPGERVALDARVIEIVDLSRLELEAMLSAADSLELQVGQEATLQVEGSPRPLPARVVRINPSAQAGSRSVLAYLAVGDTSGLRQGLFAQGTVATGRAAALAVPLPAVRTDKPSPYVQVVENGKVAHKPVTPGARGESEKETWVAVTGVQPGAMVIRGHVGPLREGTAVKFTAAAASPLPSAPPSPQPSPASGRGSKSPSP